MSIARKERKSLPTTGRIIRSVFSGNPLVIYPYLTTECHCGCEPCLVRHAYGHLQLDSRILTQCLKEFKALGGIYADPTGGDPTLAECCPIAFRSCNELDLISSLTTMGAGSERIADFIEEPTYLRFSFDGLAHDRYRGTGDFDKLCQGLEYAKCKRQKPTGIIFTVTANNCTKEDLTAVMDLARFYDVPWVWNNEFDLRLTPKQRRLFSWAARQAGVMVSLGRPILVNHTENPTCRAVSDTITLAPDGEVVLPCFHERRLSLPSSGGLESVLGSKERQHFLGQEGRLDFCQDCRNWCYLSASLPRHWHDRAAAWLHGLRAVYQPPRDRLLRCIGKSRVLHPDHPYPDYKPIT